MVDSSRSDLETFEAVCDFAEEVARQKEERLGVEGMRSIMELVSKISVSFSSEAVRGK